MKFRAQSRVVITPVLVHLPSLWPATSRPGGCPGLSLTSSHANRPGRAGVEGWLTKKREEMNSELPRPTFYLQGEPGRQRSPEPCHRGLCRDLPCGCLTFSRVRLFATPWAVATRLLCQGDSPGENTGVGRHFLLQGIFPTQGSNLGLLHCRQTLYRLSHEGRLELPTLLSSPDPDNFELLSAHHRLWVIKLVK